MGTWLNHCKGNPIRLGILNACCRDDREWSNYGILTTTMDAVFNNPDASPEKVAEFIKRLADPKLIDVCRQAFLGKQRRSELLAACGLSDQELDAAVEPVLEWGFAIWEEIDDEPKLSWRRVGFRPIITLIFMAIIQKLQLSEATKRALMRMITIANIGQYQT